MTLFIYQKKAKTWKDSSEGSRKDPEVALFVSGMSLNWLPTQVVQHWILMGEQEKAGLLEK